MAHPGDFLDGPLGVSAILEVNEGEALCEANSSRAGAGRAMEERSLTFFRVKMQRCKSDDKGLVFFPQDLNNLFRALSQVAARQLDVRVSD